MKKLVSLFAALLLMVTLIACDTKTTTVTATTVSSSSSTTTTTEDLGITKKAIEFVNYSDEFKNDGLITSLDFYYFEGKEGIPYVDIETLITMLLGIIDENIVVLEDESLDTVHVSVTYTLTAEEQAEYGIDEDSITEYVLFDFVNGTVTAPNVDSFDAFSGETETDFSSGLILVNYESEDLPLFSVDLDDYGFILNVLEIVGEETQYLLPLSIANLFLTGSMFDLVNNGDFLYGIDTYQLGALESTYSDVIEENDDQTPAMKQESINFLALVFDYFYGLKAYRNIDSFKTYLSTRFSAIRSFETSLYRFVEGLEDLHTSVITPGHTNPDYEHYSAFGEYPDYITDMYYEYWGAGCEYTDPDIETVQFYQDMAYFRINSFTKNLKDDIALGMGQIRTAGSTKVIIDMTCNGGGVLAGVFHLLSYMTNDNISFYTDTLGAFSAAEYDIEGDHALNAEFFILTSAATYSAANLFTALAKEKGLAKTIGTQSGGGACSIKAIVLPNGAIMQMSSNMNLTYSTGLTVEEGVLVDATIDWARNYNEKRAFPTMEALYVILQGLNAAE